MNVRKPLLSALLAASLMSATAGGGLAAVSPSKGTPAPAQQLPS